MFSSSNSLCRYKLLRYSRERQYIDGLNNLIYTPKILVSRLYKNITVNLIPELAPVRDYWWKWNDKLPYQNKLLTVEATNRHYKTKPTNSSLELEIFWPFDDAYLGWEVKWLYVSCISFWKKSQQLPLRCLQHETTVQAFILHILYLNHSTK